MAGAANNLVCTVAEKTFGSGIPEHDALFPVHGVDSVCRA
jgi:hypothetical protein